MQANNTENPATMHLADEKQSNSLHEHATGTNSPVLDDYPGKGSELERKLVRKVLPLRFL